MKIMRIAASVLTVVALALPGAALQAQTVTQDDAVRSLREMAAQPTPSEADRDVIRDFLNRPDVQEAARSHDIDLERLEARSATLDADAAGDLAARIRTFDDQQAMAGGDAIVISSTALIIILLVLIILLVA